MQEALLTSSKDADYKGPHIFVTDAKCAKTHPTRSALENAASIAGLLLTTEAVVTDEPEPEADHGHSHAHGGGMPGMM